MVDRLLSWIKTNILTFYLILRGADVWLGQFIRARCGETISAHVGRDHRKTIWRHMIDVVFGRDHCKNSAKTDIKEDIWLP